MRISLYVNRAEVSREKLSQFKVAVAIDVLRATTTMVTAFANGCRQIIPIAEIEQALQLAEKFDVNEVLLCGERNESAIHGFDLSNSPREYETERVRDRTLIMTTTNGSQLFSLADRSMPIAICSFLNISAVANFLTDQRSDIAILCAGKYSEFGLEDVVCGGMLIKEMLSKSGKIELNDGAIAALKLYEGYADNVLAMLMEANHGKRLLEIDLAEDLKFASQVNRFDILPIWQDGKIERYH